MRKLIALAIKNILRNKRRSIITGTAIAFGTFIMLNAFSYIAGLYEAMVNVTLNTGIGHIQIHHTGYMQALEDRMTSSGFVVQETEINTLLQNDAVRDHIQAVAKRIISPGLFSNGTDTTNGLILGMDPEVETSFFGNLAITEGEYLGSEDEQGILVSERIHRVFNVNPGDSIAVAVQASGGSFNTRNYTVVGVFDLGTEFNFRYTVDAMMNIEDAESLLASDEITEVAILLKNVDEVDSVIAALEGAAAGASLDVEIHGWQSVGKRLLDIATYMKMGMRGWTMLLFAGIALAILNTFLMSVYERTQEIGILKAIGMKRRRILSLFLLETFCLSVIAFAIALVASMISVSILSAIGLPGLFLDFLPAGEAVHSSIQSADVLICMLTAVGISTLAGLFPAWQASRMAPVEALRYE
jgi:putative ABC transport system permease protein